MSAYEYLSKILLVEPSLLQSLDEEMSKRTGKSGVMEQFAEKNKVHVERVTSDIGVAGQCGDAVRDALSKEVHKHEDQLEKHLETIEGSTEFERMANFAKDAASVGKGFFLKKEYGAEILKKRKPEHLLDFLKLSSVDELLAEHGVPEIFSALRFIETNEWMHKTFDEAYSSFTKDDFEERDIEVQVLGPEWREIGQKYVEKKRHNVSHLKEFGVIFINPIPVDIIGKSIRNSGLLLHYLHEIEFYSDLFRQYADKDDFAAHFKALLRGDILETDTVGPGEWLIVQRYLIKENPKDPRLFLPRVNPESVHWARAVNDLVVYSEGLDGMDLDFWRDLYWVGCPSTDEGAEGEKRVVSFEMGDNAFTLAARSAGKKIGYSYHQREAMWTRLLTEYVGGKDERMKLLIEHYEEGKVQF